MSSRSEIALAITTKGWGLLGKEVRSVFEDFDVKDTCDEGYYFKQDDFSWTTMNSAIAAAMAGLLALPPDTYLFRDACHDYPGSDENDAGSWYANPWEMDKDVITRIRDNLE